MKLASWILPCLAALAASLPLAMTAAEPESALVADFLASVRATVRSPQDLAALASGLRPLHTALDEALARRSSLAERQRAATRAREALAAGLMAFLPGDASRPAVDELLEEAARVHRNRRLSALEASLMCWCKDENWTRTLSGCPEPCANQQKMLIRSWLEEGITNDEIIQRMVDHPSGGSRVRAAPEARGVSWIGYLAPAAIFCVALVLVALFLRRAMRPAAGAPGAPGAAAGTGTGTGTRTGTDTDDAVAEQVERELREMES
jgi:cytochrome c-type biogenesis protein CcmH/NrfF